MEPKPDAAALNRLLSMGEELLGELGAAVPRMIERTQAQLKVTAVLLERVGCPTSLTSILAGGSRPAPVGDGTPRLQIVDSETVPDATATGEAVAKRSASSRRVPENSPAEAPVRKGAPKAPTKSPAKASTKATPEAPAKSPAKASTRKAPTATAARKAPGAKAPARKSTGTGARPRKAPSAAIVPTVGDLAIAAYDELAASQVIPRLDSLDRVELDALRRYEVANRGRRTILSRISQLQAAGSA